MKTEIKLFLLTKFLEALYNGDYEKVKNEVIEMLHTTKLPDSYWDMWFKRYDTVSLSKEVQIIMLRSANYSYRKIQNMLEVSPNTVQRVIAQYDIDYSELEDTHLLEDSIARLETRLKKAGVEIW